MKNQNGKPVKVLGIGITGKVLVKNKLSQESIHDEISSMFSDLCIADRPSINRLSVRKV
jgi:hypothetical protein